MQWWCAAQTRAWDWTWQAYPGVWLFVLLLGAGYAMLVRRTSKPTGGGVAGSPEGGQPSRGQVASFAGGLFILWLALDWPIGALGAGYLASVHMLQFLLIALVAPPLLLLGIPRSAYLRIRARPRLHSAMRVATQPLLTLSFFIGVVIATHLPVVVDTLMASQLGSFAIDMLWLAGGLLYWWPVVAPVPQRARFSYPLKMGYLIATTVLMTAPGAMITFSWFPVYGTYELAPPVAGIASIDEQRVAGLMMKIGGGLIAWFAIGVLFYRWVRTESDHAEPLLARRSAGQ